MNKSRGIRSLAMRCLLLGFLLIYLFYRSWREADKDYLIFTAVAVLVGLRVMFGNIGNGLRMAISARFSRLHWAKNDLIQSGSGSPLITRLRNCAPSL